MGNEQSSMSDNERRLTVLETKFELLAETMTNAILRLEKKLDELSHNFVTKESLDGKLEIRDREINALKNEIATIKEDKKSTKNNLPVWIGIIPAAISVIVAIIAIYK